MRQLGKKSGDERDKIIEKTKTKVGKGGNVGLLGGGRLESSGTGGNNIPVYCPGLTDGSLGDMLSFHSFHNTGGPDNPGLNVDIVQGFYSILFTLYCMDDFETIGIK
ncbi:deoxyhypusine synthase [Medicago truncatula]|uniref:Deoxyhypusine synthase n=1 Tax=Medicago truncatula TaxID=3880 RepID=A0A072TST9_MEDTR|nr:deoxyhypusine synthase [Medicago truncatula]